MSYTINVLLEQAGEPGVWTTSALDLPDAQVLAIWDDKGGQPPFERSGSRVRVGPDVTVARARISLASSLVAATALDDAKIAFDKQKLAADERAGRRTLWVSLVSVVVTAAATITVALIARPGRPESPAAPPTFRQLSGCQDSLNRLRTLSGQPTQTLVSLRALIQHHDDACRDPLKAAVDSSPSS